MGQPQRPIAAEHTIIALGRVLQTLREEDNVDVLIDTTIAYIQEQFDYNLVWIALYDLPKHTLVGKGGVAPDGDTKFLRKQVTLTPGGLLEQVVIEQRPLGVADLRLEPRAAEWQEIGKKFNIQGTVVLPIRYRDRFLGLLLFGSERWGYLLPGDAKARLLMVLGELGAVLYQQELNLQQQQTKHLDQPILHLLENLRTLNNIDQKLKAVVQTTHQFVAPSRTNIYWFERQGRYFWCRMSNQLANIGRNNSQQQLAAGMTVQDLSEFYYALSVNQIVLIGDERSSLKSHFTAKVLERLQVRSLLAAPIMWQKELLGFLAVEANEPRIWTEADKNFVQSAAGLVSLVAPSETMDTTIKQIQEDAQLTSQVAQAIYHEDDLQATLRTCATKVLTRFAATRFLLLQYNPDLNSYQIIFQTQPQNRRPLTVSFNTLKDMDEQMLKSATTAVEVQKVEEDLRFFNWRPLLLEHGMRSLLVCNCAQEHTPNALLVIAHETNRGWASLDKELLWAVSQQIGVIVRQWQLNAEVEQQQKILHSIQRCLRILEKTQNDTTESGVERLERTAIEQIATVLHSPLAVLLSWSPGDNFAEIIPSVIHDSRFAVVTDQPVPIHTEAIIQWALAKDDYVCVYADDLPAETRKWLNGQNIGQVLAIALRTSADYAPTGVVLVADYRERYWTEQSLNATETLVTQLAWSRRQQQITKLLESSNQELRQLNWYKHRRLEEIQRTATQLFSQIEDLGIPSNELTQTRYKLLLRQLDHNTAAMTALVKLEQWQLHQSSETMPIASLLKRSLERVDNLLKQRKLWAGVHGLGQSATDTDSGNSGIFLKGLQSSSYPSSLAITGDIVKFELVLYELLIVACNRSQSGGRIDIWCRRLEEKLLEISITDHGMIEPPLLAALQHQIPKDILARSYLNQPPALHLLICQQLTQQLGGTLDFYQLPDYRVVSRLVLPLAD
ncbi:GAF domain-containing protein [Nostoc sp. FACHB-87]|uniref:sensor histidine kinase n=1 Tax=Nostocaceae TaxID=1162 RepID=UPI001681FB9B|nr:MULTISPECIES: GAF domain-containing protein [Nostocaceae]MBD2455298.1 GAF domain-containing protein [Nostoc sp. FACHB-87]MBD2476877.1 GAF domain-containing protein [Anabaena sp. FACHB-83]